MRRTKRGVSVRSAPWIDDTLAANGRSVCHNFLDWFQNGRLVEETGQPRAVYHGADRDFPSFNPSNCGNFGFGVYFSDSPAVAGKWASSGEGDRLMPVYLSLQNPFSTPTEYDAGEDVDIDSPAVPLLRSVFGKDAPREIERLRNSEDCHIGSDVRDRLVAMGDDGIIAAYKDGSLEYIAFRADQIKSALGNSGLYLKGNLSVTDHEEGPDVSPVRCRSRDLASLAQQFVVQLARHADLSRVSP